MTTTPSNTVVVGVDGSDCSRAAVRWAEEFARLRGGSLKLVTAWHWPTSYGTPIAFEGFNPQEDAEKVVEAAAADVDLPIDRIHVHVAQGAAGDVLVRASEGAAALVVGTRGHGAVTGALLGSTSSFCTHHADCPVVVVR